MESHASAPPVVAVVVTCDPGPWFEEALASLGAQDYPNFSVLVIDAASTADPTARVAAVLPSAYVRRLPQRTGFGRAANEVLAVVEGASHYLLCHDDVAVDPDAVRLLVEEAFRSNAGLAAPKLVDWDDPRHLLAVGAAVDRVGAGFNPVDPGELDQEQHDAVRDVFFAPGAATLVRADLFAALGGFDPGVDDFGEDLDLGWRVQLAGSRVVVVPRARVRHLEATVRGLRRGWDDVGATARAERRRSAHQIRTVLACAAWWRLPWVLTLLAASALTRAGWLAVTGRSRVARATLAGLVAGPGPGRSGAGVRSARRRAQGHRQVRESDVRHSQLSGSAWVREELRRRTGPAGAGPTGDRYPEPVGSGARTGLAGLAAAARVALPGGGAGPLLTAEVVTPPAGAVSDGWGRGDQPDRAEVPAGHDGDGPASWRWIVWAVVLAALVIGCRDLLGRPLPAIGDLPSLGAGPGRWWASWRSSWRPAGLGSGAPAPTGLLLLAAGGILTLGRLGVLQHLLVLGPLLVGPVGIYRATGRLGSLRGRLVAVIVYASAPLAVNALAAGRWAGLLVYAAAPWLVAGTTVATRTVDDPGGGRLVWGSLTGAALALAALSAFVPAALFLLPLVAVGVALGSFLIGRWTGTVRILGSAAAVTAGAVILLLPWSVDVLGSRRALFGPRPATLGQGFGAALRLSTGPVGRGPLGWCFLAAAALPLLIGSSWRLTWAARLWGIILVCCGAAWASGRGWTGIPLPAPEVLLAPAAAAMAVSAALGAAAFDLDLPGYRLGWRQVAGAAALLAVALGSLPVVAASVDGRWHLPGSDLAAALAWMRPQAGSADFRVVWAGDPAALPLAGWPLQPGLVYATSVDGPPGVEGRWAPGDAGATPVLAADLRLALAGRTAQLGHLLAPLAVRYLVVPNRNAPVGKGSRAAVAPAGLLGGLAGQIDLRAVAGDPALTIYENTAWMPLRAVLPPGAVAASRSPSPAVAESAPLAGAPAVLPGTAPDRAAGPVPAGDVILAATASPAWQLRVGGTATTARRAFGWAQGFHVDAPGRALLRHRAGPLRWWFSVAQILLWLFALVVAAGTLTARRPLRLRRRTAASAVPAALRAAGEPGDEGELWR